jgi:hypothetical protein
MFAGHVFPSERKYQFFTQFWLWKLIFLYVCCLIWFFFQCVNCQMAVQDYLPLTTAMPNYQSSATILSTGVGFCLKYDWQWWMMFKVGAWSYPSKAASLDITHAWVLSKAIINQKPTFVY